ncbi:MAG: hypothetical protein ACTHOO_05435 [Alcanivorax sp.]
MIDPPNQTSDNNKQVYQAFALSTYTTVRNALSEGLKESTDGLPILVVIGEQHMDSQPELDANEYTPDDQEEPAVAAAFTEIGALEAAARLVGKENMALSIEIPPDRLPYYVGRIRDNDGVIPDSDMEHPFMHTLAYAINNNIEIIPTDPGLEYVIENEELREQMQRDAIAAIGVGDDAPRVVVHVGGHYHLSNFAGFSNQEIRDTLGQVTRDERESPFDGVYNDVLFFNTARDTDEFIRSMGVHLNATAIGEAYYSENPANAIQIDAPGAMSEDVQHNIGEMVRQAAADYNTNMRAPQNDTIDTINTIKSGM